jgi:lipopolysaccharide cholinephosphotransferase
MISKTILNENITGFSLSDEQKNDLKRVLLGILVDVDATCKKHGLHYYLAWGTLLGAVRHHGFIPWDDDIDIFVPFLEMEKLSTAMKEDYGERYFFGGIYPKNGEDPNCLLKIMLSGTSFTEIQNTQVPFPRGIGIDAFPIIEMPKNAFHEFLRKKQGDFLRHAIAVGIEYHYPPTNLLKNKNKKTRKYFKMRRFIGFCLSFLPLRSWKKKYFNYLSKKYKNCNNFGLGPDMFYQCGDDCVDKDFLKSQTIVFENHNLSCFSKYDSLLRQLYGDYMTIPPTAKRECHIIAGISFPKK